MSEHNHLNEPAAPEADDIGALWHVDDGVGVFSGPLGRNASHSHAVPVYVTGVYGTFGLRINGGKWLSCRTAVIPAGLPYEFDVGGNPLSVVYLEPTIAGVEALTPLIRNAREENGALVGSAGEISLMRELFEDRDSTQWAGFALKDIVGFSKRQASNSIDPRALRAVKQLQNNYAELTPVDELAKSVGLSSSRFQHVFSQAVGAPIRRYRSWHRMRGAIREIVKGSNFTQAAHAAGYTDQPHFIRDCRRIFGATPSKGLKGIRRSAC